jgi:hypothetical protein
MMEKIGKNSYLSIHNNIFTLKIRKPFWVHAFALITTGGFFVGLYFWSPGEWETQVRGNILYLFWGMAILHVSVSVYNLSLRDNYEMDMNRNTVFRKKSVIGVLIRNTEIQWEKDCKYLYEVEFDSYKNITAVWLTAFQRVKNSKRRLLKFYDMKTFEAFRSIFQVKYPSCPIGEWHE